MEEQKKFTIAEIKKYLQSQDSFGDALYNLKAENIVKANEHKSGEGFTEPSYG